MDIFPRLRGAIIACDTETFGLEWAESENKGINHVFGVSIAYQQDGEMRSHYYDLRSTPKAIQYMQDLADPAAGNRFVNHNLKFDIHCLRTAGIMFNPAVCECTMIRAALIDEHLKNYSLDSLAKKYLGKEKDTDVYHALAEQFGGEATRKKQIEKLSEAPEGIVAKYAKVDAELALELWAWQEEEIKRQELERIWRFEFDLFPHIVQMESKGIRVNADLARKTMDDITVQVDAIQNKLDEVAGFHVNPNPSGDIHALFKPEKDENNIWKLVDGTPCPATGAGKASINSDVLRAMKHPAAALILECRKLMKTRDTFLKGHVLSNVHGGRVYPSINQVKGESGGDSAGGMMEGTTTGRFSYSRPALQQIPNRDKRIAELVRPIFLPDEGHVWSYGDLDQHEFRVFVHYAKPANLLKQYAEDPNLDIHTQVAELMHIPRNPQAGGGPNAKQINLGLSFCMGAGRMAKLMQMPYTEEKMSIRGEPERMMLIAGDEAKGLFELYYKSVPGIREFQKKAASIATSRGYVKTIAGRHIRFPDKRKLYKAPAMIFQGSSADLNKQNVRRISEYLNETGQGRLLLNIHDEYSVSLPEGADHRKILKDLQAIVQDKPELRVPIRIDFSEGASNWWAATKSEHAT